MCLTVTPVNASATEYLKGDINGDNSVNSADLVALNSFLNGKQGATGETVQKLDLTGNYIIDKEDLNLLKSIILGSTKTNKVTLTSTTDNVSHNDYVPFEKSYVKFNATNGNEIKTYDINPVNYITNSGISENQFIIGKDDRVVDYSQSGVVIITNGSKILGTGFIVDSNKILTAAHILYDTENDIQQTNVQYMLYNSNGKKIDINGNVVSNQNDYNGIKANSYHIPKRFITAYSGVPNTSSGSPFEASGYGFDYALIKVNEDLSKYQGFDVGVARNNLSSSQKLYITGYNTNNKEVNDNQGVAEALRGKIVTGYGYLYPGRDFHNKMTKFNLYYNVDIMPGQSGSPIYIKNSNGSKTVIGINIAAINEQGSPIGAFNEGTRFNTKILTFIFNNPNF